MPTPLILFNHDASSSVAEKEKFWEQIKKVVMIFLEILRDLGWQPVSK